MREGSRVAIFDIREPRWDIGDALFLKVDVSNPFQVREAIDLVYLRFGRIDVLVNNAGIESYASVHECSEEE